MVGYSSLFPSFFILHFPLFFFTAGRPLASQPESEAMQSFLIPLHELTERQRKLVEEDQTQTLDQQENMKISGTNARHMVMQKLMRKASEVCCSEILCIAVDVFFSSKYRIG
jgi:hypothetical protein